MSIKKTIEKDPAFLMYAKDWLQGTADMMPEEKGVYIDLLCHQHQDGSLPTDTRRLARLSGMSEDAFLPIWETLRQKFKPTNGNRLVNPKLSKVITERSTRSLTNRITGEFAYLIRSKELTDNQKEGLKRDFSVDLFDQLEPHLVRGAVTKWFNDWLNHR